MTASCNTVFFGEGWILMTELGSRALPSPARRQWGSTGPRPAVWPASPIRLRHNFVLTMDLLPMCFSFLTTTRQKYEEPTKLRPYLHG